MKTPFFSLFLLLSGWCSAQQNIDIERRLDSLHQTVFELLRREKIAESRVVASTYLALAVENKDILPRYYARALELHIALMPAKADSLIKVIKDFRKNKLGTEDTDWARTLNSEGMMLRYQGKVEEAMPLLQEATRLIERDSGRNSLLYARICQHYATLLYFDGKYAKADSLYQEALKTQKGTNPAYIRDTIDYANSLLDITSFYNDMGRLREMERVAIECRDLRAVAIGTHSTGYAQALNNLAVYYSRTGQFYCAKDMYREALERLLDNQKRSGILDGDAYGTALNNLGNTWQQIGQLDSAEIYLDSALALRAVMPGKKHRSYFSTLLSLGTVFYLKEEYAKAESCWRETEIWARERKNYFVLAPIAQNFGESFLRRGLPDTAWTYFQEALRINREILQLREDHPEIIKTLRSLASAKPDTPEGKKYLAEATQLMLQYLRNQATFSSEFEMQQQMRSLLTDFEKLYGFMLEHLSPEVAGDAYNTVLVLKENLLKNAAALKKLAGKAHEAELQAWRDKRRELSKYPKKEKVAQLRADIATLEKQLASVLKFPSPVYWTQVRDALQAGEAAVEYIQYRPSQPKKGEPSRYAALVLRPGDKSPHFVHLCDETALKRLWATYEKFDTENKKMVSSVNDFDQLYAYKRTDGPSLYALIWEPLDTLLKGMKTIYYSPTGYINLFNPRAMQQPDVEYLPYQFVTLSSTVNLVNKSAEPKPPTHAVIFGGIAPGDSVMWKEASTLADMFSHKNVTLSLNTGPAATENTFYEACELWPDTARVLMHMAIHGIFEKPVAQPRGSCDVFLSDDPMFQSYMMLNPDNGKIQEGQEGNDGKITAYDFSVLDLSAVELVYLSSCETGLGTVRGFEGVFGLQRALKISGVKKIIVCLNGVPSSAAQKMTIEFYKKWLTGGGKKTVREAFHEAQMEMKGEMKEKIGASHHWASFILIE